MNSEQADGCEGYISSYSERLAHWAKSELLKEKIKEKMNAKYGTKMDKIAQLIVDVISERSKSKDEIAEKETQLESAWDELENAK